MNTTYLALTIGPIYKTMLRARKTREVWVSSYLFSFIMQKIVEEASKYGDIILPYPKKNPENFNGAGIFPDRLIMTLNDENLNIQEKVVGAALIKTAKELSLNATLLDNYTQISFVVINEVQLNDFEMKNEKGEAIISFIHKLNFILDNQELQAKYNATNEVFLKDLFDHKTRKKFYDLGFGNKRHSFPSILEISAQAALTPQIRGILEKDDDSSFSNEEQLEYDNFIAKLPKHQKYMAILRADGDNFGKVISEISSDIQQVKSFSETLTRFSEEAAKIINDFGGAVVYIGGDDIVCFAPVVNTQGENIFQLVNDLNACFYNFFNEDVYKQANVSLSYGLSLTYYKYPLNEALDLSYNLLFYKSKKYEPKNCITFQLLQHSGQYRETRLTFGENYNSFLKMLENFKDKDALLQSLTHKLMEDEKILLEVLQKKERFLGYFENHFAAESKKAATRGFIESVKENILSSYEILNHDGKNTLIQMNTICRILKFLSKDEQQIPNALHANG